MKNTAQFSEPWMKSLFLSTVWMALVTRSDIEALVIFYKCVPHMQFNCTKLSEAVDKTNKQK